MSKRVPQLPRAAQRILEASVRDRKTAPQAAELLAECGISMSHRTIYRRMAELRDEDKRCIDLQMLGLGFGLAEKNLGSVAELVQRIAPGWRAQEASDLHGILSNFLRNPTPNRYIGLITRAYSFLVADSVVNRLNQQHQGEHKQ